MCTVTWHEALEFCLPCQGTVIHLVDSSDVRRAIDHLLQRMVALVN